MEPPQTLRIEEMHFISNVLPKLFNSPQDFSKLSLEWCQSAFGHSHRGVRFIILFGTHEKVDNLCVKPGYYGFQSICIGIDILIVLTSPNTIDDIGKCCTELLRCALVTDSHLTREKLHSEILQEVA
jgi:hypothetical protein